MEDDKEGEETLSLFDDAHPHAVANLLKFVKHSLLNIRLIS